MPPESPILIAILEVPSVDTVLNEITICFMPEGMPVKSIAVPDVELIGVPRVKPAEIAAQDASPRQNVLADAEVPEFKFVTGKLPVTPVVSGNPVALVSTNVVGVPKLGVVSTGAVSVLLVSVVVLDAVTILLGVMIPDSATVAMIYPYIRAVWAK